MKKWVLVLFVCAAPALKAQNPFQPQQRETKVIQLKHIDSNRLDRRGLLAPFNVEWRGDGPTVVLSGEPAKIAAAEAFIRSLDMRPRNIEAIFYILAASATAGQSSGITNELEPVIKQLRNAFAYQSFKLLETAITRGRENGELGGSGHLPVTDPDSSMKRTYNFRVERVAISPGEKGDMVRFDKLEFWVHSPDIVKTNVTKKPEFTTAGIRADLDVREGQKVVVGKSNFDGAEGAFFLIVTAKVVD
jgi:hypothetical protein